MVKIIGIGGSLKPTSSNRKALVVALERVAALGAETRLLDLHTLSLPFCNGDRDYPDYPDVEQLRYLVAGADGLILASPEYHGSLSGVLKNALDLMSTQELEGKVVGLVSTLGGPANSNALNDMRIILRWVHSWVIPEQIAIGQSWQAFGEDGQLLDPRLSERFDKFAQSLVTHTRKLRGESP